MAEKRLWVTSIYGHKGREPLVALTMPGGETVQMTPEEARDLALNLLTGAEAAEQDGFMFEWATNVGVDERGAAGLLEEFRKHRESKGKRTK